MSRKELAIRTGFSEKHVSTVINGQKSISPSFAKKLEYALKIPASDGLNRQNEYDNALLDYEEKNNISSDELAILKPLKDILEYMNQFQLLPKTLSEPEKILELRKFFRVSSLSVIPKIPYNAAYRAQISNNVAVALIFGEPNAMQEQLKEIFAECGIAFRIVKHFRGATVQSFIKHTEGGQLILCMTIRQFKISPLRTIIHVNLFWDFPKTIK